MQIVYVTETYPPELNGVALTVERTVRYLRGRGHAVQLIRPRQRGDAARDDGSEWRTAGAPIPMYPDLRVGLASGRTLRRRFAASDPAIVHVATPGPLGRAAVLAASSLGIPVTSDFRTNFHRYARFYRLGRLESLVLAYLRSLHNRSSCTLVPTAAIACELATHRFERLEVLGRGVDADLFSPRKRSTALRAAWGAADGEPVLLYVGRLAAEKNVELALRAHAAYRAIRPDAKLILVGDGPLAASLRIRYPAATFVGVRRGEALAVHYASADLLLFPSESETFGNVTLEGMASGLAVVAFDAAAAAEHIVPNASGWLVPRGRPERYVATAVGVAQMPIEALEAARRQARSHALGQSWDSVLDRFEAFLVLHARRRIEERARDVVVADQRERWAGKDLAWAIALHRAASHPGTLKLLVGASRLGDGVLWYVAIATLPVLDRVDGWLCAIQMSAVGVVNLVLYAGVKRRIGRPRPFAVCPDIRACARALDRFSFPSGHVLHAVAYAVVLCYHYPALGTVVWFYAALVAASRVVLGLHYPSDVLAGALTGLATGSAAVLLGRLL